MTTLRLMPLLAALALSGAACTEPREPAGAVPPATRPADDLHERLARVRLQVLRDRGVAEANALNAPGSDEVLARLDRQLEGLAVYARIPQEPAATALREALATYSAGHALTVADFVAEELAPEPRELPHVLTGPGKVRYEPDDLRGVLAVTFTLAPLDIGRLEPWLSGLPRGLERMLLVREVHGRRDRLEVRAEAWWFLAERWPRHEPAPRALASYLEEAGVSAEPAELTRLHPVIWSQIEELHAELVAFSPAIERSLTLLSRANLLESRFDLFTDRAKAIEGLEVLDVLR